MKLDIRDGYNFHHVYSSFPQWVENGNLADLQEYNYPLQWPSEYLVTATGNVRTGKYQDGLSQRNYTYALNLATFGSGLVYSGRVTRFNLNDNSFSVVSNIRVNIWAIGY